MLMVRFPKSCPCADDGLRLVEFWWALIGLVDRVFPGFRLAGRPNDLNGYVIVLPVRVH
jgi:hypothetical protein